MSLICDAWPWILRGLEENTWMSFILEWCVCPSLWTPRFLLKWPLTPRQQIVTCQEVQIQQIKEKKKANTNQWMWKEQEHFRSCDSQLTQLCWVCGCCSLPFHTLGLQLRFVLQTQKLFTFQPVAGPLSAHAALCTLLLSMGRKSISVD